MKTITLNIPCIELEDEINLELKEIEKEIRPLIATMNYNSKFKILAKRRAELWDSLKRLCKDVKLNNPKREYDAITFKQIK